MWSRQNATGTAGVREKAPECKGENALAEHEPRETGTDEQRAAEADVADWQTIVLRL